MKTVGNCLKRLLIAIVRGYQICVSPFLRFLNGGHGSCRHTPTCSQYAIDAFRLHGPYRGLWLSIRRLFRCHPWGTFGFDPVPAIKFTDEYWMCHAIMLAKRGSGHTDPNPIVGAVIVRDGELLGSGWHEKDGGPHAEVNAINDVKGRGQSCRGASLFVTMEPCSTLGRTGACTEHIITEGFAHVYIGALDPNPAHNGRALFILQRAGIHVTIGAFRQECADLNPEYNRRMADLAKQLVS